MSHGSRLAIAGSLVVGFLGGHLWTGSTHQANAQPPARAAEQGRYSVTSWAMNAAHGAYVVDTQTGEVFLVSGDLKPTSLGKPTSK